MKSTNNNNEKMLNKQTKASDKLISCLLYRFCTLCMENTKQIINLIKMQTKKTEKNVYIDSKYIPRRHNDDVN